MIPLIKNQSLFYKVLLIDQKIVGFCLGDIKESSLKRLYTHPDYFYKGYGTILLETLENYLIDNGRSNINVACDKLNTIGNNFYKKHGFQISNEIDEDYIFEKSL